ncbi:hypothetical protein DV738_g3017, partial [Chaetothyriales sp. CBS 135597]
MNLPSVVLALVWFISSGVHAVCQSYGTDFQDGGSYCIDPRLTDVFSFGTEWYGCTANDTQDGVDPYISGPDGEGQYCSNIQTNPDGQEMISTCNVDGDALTKNNMYSGNWTIGFYGLTFAYQREFYLNVEIPETVISTPTVSITITDTPSTTETSITTYTTTTTLEPDTVTVPSATVVYTITETPPISITTVTQTIFKTVQTFTLSESTIVSTYTCSGNPWRLLDPIATWTPAVVAASLASQSEPTPTGRTWPPFGGIIPGLPWFGPGHANVAKDAHVTARGLLAKRTPDPCTITSVANSTQSVTVTTTAPTSTITVPEATTVTATVYPSPVTSYAGEASETITVTLPAETLTRLEVTRGVTTDTVEIVAT